MKLALITPWLLILVAACAPRHDDGERAPTGGPVKPGPVKPVDDGKPVKPPPTITPPPANAKAPGLETLQAILASGEADTLDAFLGKLPEEFRAYFTLFHASNSLQRATEVSPRAILFGGDAKLVMAFGESDDTIEMMRFIEETGSYEFREIVFKEKQGERPTLSESDPERCGVCHGGSANPRPNWEPYFRWPGAFGEEDDGVIEGSAEHLAIQKFVAGYAARPRYRSLVNVAEKYATRSPVDSRLEPGKKLLGYESRGNRALTILFNEQNVKRMAGMLAAQTEAFAKDKFFVAALLADCFPKLTPDDLNAIKAKDPRVATYLAAAPSFGAERRIAAAQLNVEIDFDSWTLSRSGSMKTAPGMFVPANRFDSASRIQDGQGEATELYFVPTALDGIDPAFEGLAATMCPDGGNQVLVAAKAGVLATTSGSTFCADGQAKVCAQIARGWRSAP